MAIGLFNRTEEKKNPVDTVNDLRSQGLDNNQIFQTMQRDGYQSGQVYDALHLAKQRESFVRPNEYTPAVTESVNPMAMNPQSVVPESQYNNPSIYGNQQFPPMNPMPMPQMGQMNGMMPPMQNQMQQMPQDTGSDTSEIEELIEAVISEKWKEIESNLNKVLEWKDKADQKLTGMQQQITDVKSQFDSLQKAIVGKIGDYDKNILEVGTQLSAMEKAFSKVLPTFTENINELNRITQKLKK